MGVKLQSALGGSVELNAPSTASNFTMTVPAGNGTVATTDQIVGFRNRIINGDMRIDQRNAGASVTPTDGQFSVDRWKASLNVASKFSLQRSTTAPAGFNNSLLATSLSSYSIGVGEVTGVMHLIEGFNTADLGWGTANAQSVTLSFWVRSSLTGTFGGSLRNGSSNRSFPFSYSISAANTWEYKSITITGDTTGTWATDNSTSIIVYIALGVGSTFSSTAGSWQSGNFVSVTGATSVVGTNGATFYITGVQLEKGSTATSFDYRPYGTELALCQRYFEVGFFNTACNLPNLASGSYSNATESSTPIAFKVTKRAGPTVTESFVTINAVANWANAGASSISSEFYVTKVITNAVTTSFVNKSAMYYASAEL